MTSRPRRECRSIFRRDLSPHNVKAKRKSVGREDLVSKNRKLSDLSVTLEPPENTIFSPVARTPNPSMRRISVSPLGLPSELPEELSTNWDPSPVVGRRTTPALVSPLWNLNEDDLVDEPAVNKAVETEGCDRIPDLQPLIESDDEEEAVPRPLLSTRS